MAVRLDKWLQVARAFKTRTQATRACAAGKVHVNGLAAKAHKPVVVGDRIEIEKGEWTRVLEVVEPRDKPLPKKEASRVYLDHSPPPPARDPLERLLRLPGVLRPRGAGRPTKRQRRELERLRQR